MKLTIQFYQMKAKIFIKLSLTSKVIEGHITSLLYLENTLSQIYCLLSNQLSSKLYECIKLYFFSKLNFDFKGHAMERLCDFFTFSPFNLITTLTYALMDNFCACSMLMLMNILCKNLHEYNHFILQHLISFTLNFFRIIPFFYEISDF